MGTTRDDAAGIDKRGRGRPETRNREAIMIAIWTAVQREIHVNGAPSVRQACKRLIERGSGRLVFMDSATGDKVSVIGGDESLRSYFKVAERCRKQPGKYPALAAKAELLERTLPGTAQAMKLRAQRHRDWLWAGTPLGDDYPLE